MATQTEITDDTRTLRLPARPGPAVYYVSGDDGGVCEVVQVDCRAVEDPRERALCRALLMHALALLDAAGSEPGSST